MRPRVRVTAVLMMVIAARLALGSDVWTGGESARFYDPDGNLLPFGTYEEVEEFLRSAEIVAMERMTLGTSKENRLVTLRQGEHRAHAILRKRYEVKDTPTGGFVDSYLSELAAYELATLLGLDTVPPVVRRKGGSLQIWIENASTYADQRAAGREPADREYFGRQISDMEVFDNLIANIDRNPGNILIDGDGRVWLIDHTRSFAGQEELPAPERIVGCSRELQRRLRTVSDEAIRQAVGRYAKGHTSELLIRRELVLEVLDRQTADSEPRR